MVVNLNRVSHEKMFGVKSNLKNSNYFFMTMGDKFSVVYGGWSVYKYYYDLAIKEGKSPAEAKKIGLEEFETASNRTQQSGFISDLPSMMRTGGSWANFFTMFVTQQNIYYRKESTALRNLFARRGSAVENVKIFALSHFVLPMWWQFVGNGFRWDDEDELRAALLGSINGILVWGSVIEATAERAMGSPFGIVSNPFLDSIEKAGKAVAGAYKYLAEGDYNAKGIASELHKVVTGVATLKGIPYGQITKEAEGIYKFVQNPTPGGAMKLSGFSSYSLGEKEMRKDLLDRWTEYHEQPKAERSQKELDQLKAEIEDYNKNAAARELPLIKEAERKRFAEEPKATAIRLLNDSGDRLLGEESAKMFRHKIKIALKNGDITQQQYDTWTTEFEQKQKKQKENKDFYYERGEEVPKKSKQSSSAAPKGPQGPKMPKPYKFKSIPLNIQ
jgi:regulator of RNase E activity RraB